MIYETTARDFFYETTESALTYYITCEGVTIYSGAAIKSPNEAYLRINIGRRVSDYLNTSMPDFRNYDGVLVQHPNQLREFELCNVDGTVLESYLVLMSYEDAGITIDFGELSEPIDGKADPRQKVFFGYANLDDNPVDIEVLSSLPFIFNIDESLLVFPASGGTFYVPFASSRDDFLISESCSEYSVSSDGNNLVFNVEPIDGYATCDFTVYVPDKDLKCFVPGTAYTYTVEIYSSRYVRFTSYPTQITPLQQDISFSWASNCDEGFVVEVYSGTTRGSESSLVSSGSTMLKTYTANAGRNTGETPVYYKVVVKGYSSDYEVVSDTATIVQGFPTSYTYSITADGFGEYVYFPHRMLNHTEAVATADWLLDFVEDRVNILANESGSERTGSFYYTDISGDTVTVNITQGTMGSIPNNVIYYRDYHNQSTVESEQAVFNTAKVYDIDGNELTLISDTATSGGKRALTYSGEIYEIGVDAFRYDGASETGPTQCGAFWLPDTVKKIDAGAFNYYDGGQTIAQIRGLLTADYVGNGSFRNVLTVYPEFTYQYKGSIVPQVLFDGNGIARKIVVPEGITELGSGCFCGSFANAYIEEIHIAGSVTTIGSNAIGPDRISDVYMYHTEKLPEYHFSRSKPTFMVLHIKQGVDYSDFIQGLIASDYSVVADL